MIWFFNLERASGGVCDSYSDLFQYLCKKEKVELKDKQFPEALIGDADKHLFKKRWCLKYCKNHRYVIIENKGAPMH